MGQIIGDISDPCLSRQRLLDCPIFFLLLCLWKRGRRLAGAWPFIQQEVQNDAEQPLCTVTRVAAVKSAMSSLSVGSSMPFQGRSGFIQANQSHLTRRALLNLFRSTIPKPPNCTGLATIGHATLHLAPVISLSPAHRNRRRALSKSSISCFGTFSEVRR